MGLLDSIGNLGGLGQITKTLDAGQWIKQGINSVLPKNMAVVGDIAGAVFDVNTGKCSRRRAARYGRDEGPAAGDEVAAQQPGQQGSREPAGSSASANPNARPVAAAGTLEADPTWVP